MRENLNQWDFVIAAYAVGGIAILALLLWAIWDMRRAEHRRDKSRRKDQGS